MDACISLGMTHFNLRERERERKREWVSEWVSKSSALLRKSSCGVMLWWMRVSLVAEIRNEAMKWSWSDCEVVDGGGSFLFIRGTEKCVVEGGDGRKEKEHFWGSGWLKGKRKRREEVSRWSNVPKLGSLSDFTLSAVRDGSVQVSNRPRLASFWSWPHWLAHFPLFVHCLSPLSLLLYVDLCCENPPRC